MRQYLIQFSLLLVFLLSATGASAQEVLRGVVKDEQGKPVASANIILYQHENTPILSFAITNENGEFSVKRPPNLDSIFVTVTHLSYAPQQFYIPKSQPFLEVNVTSQKYELPELIVKTEPVTRRGDTLIFNVSSYRQASDQNIEQVLSRIPGITVESNGQIRYDGLDISKFYIEGLDMLEGRYRIATRNLSIDAIRDIEIIERHQPIRVLDSLVRPDNAAINLRLKSNIAITGSLRGGAGAAPALYAGGGDVFGFSKKQQFNVSASVNNIGENQRANFQNLYTNALNVASDLIFVNKVLPPFTIRENYYLDNRELTGGFNYLRKVSEYTELKWQGFARQDRIQNIGSRQLRYRDGEREVVFAEVLRAAERPLDLNNRLIFELNAPKLFFRADANAELNIVESIAENEVNNSPFPEQLRRHEFNGFAALTTIIKRNQKAYQINADVQHQATDYDLQLMPVDIFTPDFPATRFPKALQTARYNKTGVNIYSNLFFKTKQVNGQVNIGVDYNRTALDTDIFTNNDTTENESLGQAFQNQNVTNVFAPYINQTYRREKNNAIWKLSIPLSAHVLSIDNRMNDTQRSFDILVAAPRLEYTLRLPKGQSFNTAYTFRQDYDRFNTLFYEGYIIQSNRNIATSVFDINRYQQQELYARFAGQNLEKGSHYALTATLSETRYDFINDNTFNQFGLTSAVMQGRNTLKRATLQGNLSGKIGNNLSADVRTSYSFSARPGFLNGREVNIQNHFFTINPAIYYTLTNSIISLKPRLQLFSNNLANFPARQISAELVYFLKLEKIGSFRLGYDQYLTSVGSRNVWNELLHVEYKYSLPKLKADIIFHVNNLTGNTHYVTFTQTTFSENFSFYQLRPRQVIFRFEKKF